MTGVVRGFSCKVGEIAAKSSRSASVFMSAFVADLHRGGYQGAGAEVALAVSGRIGNI